MVVLDFLREKGKAPMRLDHFANPSPRLARGFLLLPIAGLLAALMIAACTGAAPTPSPSPKPTPTPTMAPTLNGHAQSDTEPESDGRRGFPSHADR